MTRTTSCTRTRTSRRPSHARSSLGPADFGSLAVAALGLGAADGDQLEAVRAGAEGSRRLRSHAHHVPLTQVQHLVIDQDLPGSAHDHVGLLLLAVPMAALALVVRRVAPVADPEVAGVEVLTAEASLQALDLVGRRVVDLKQVDFGEVGHGTESRQAPAPGQPQKSRRAAANSSLADDARATLVRRASGRARTASS